jgi:hypothetical protein
MIIHQLSNSTPVDLARALKEFEQNFSYPLGLQHSFRISHGEDYSLFFRAQGEASCFVAEQQGTVLGSLGAVIRTLYLPDGQECPTVYFGDLKIAPQARGGAVLLRLARAADEWVRPRVQAAFGVVMGGTSKTPENYTGRAGIPGFQELGRLAILRIAWPQMDRQRTSSNFQTSLASGLALFQNLCRGRFACAPGDPTLRSGITPAWLVHPTGSACGLLEDTSKAKQLISNDGSELRSAHLSCFAYRSVCAAAELIRAALYLAAGFDLPAVFVAVAEPDAEQLIAALQGLDVLTASAIVYGAGLKPGFWNINSSEI